MHNFLHTHGTRLGALSTSIIAGLLVAGLTLALMGAAPIATGSVYGYQPTVLLQARGVTQTVDAVGAAQLSGGYGYADCYSVVDATLGQTATVKLQHSYNGQNWVDLLSFPDELTDTTDFTQTALFGGYTRAEISALFNTNPITVSVLCDFKNTR